MRKPESIKKIFNEISDYYDFMNNIISLGFHMSIKKQCVKLLEIPDKCKILDLCCGTGDILKIIETQHPNADLYGLDFSEKMLEKAKRKNIKAWLTTADACQMPFEENSFDIITMCFGLRNIPDKQSVLKEIYRVLKNNGKILHLDFGEKNILNSLFNISVPITAKILHKNYNAYDYLIDSKENFYNPNELINLFDNNGFRLLKRKDFIFHSISAQIYKK